MFWLLESDRVRQLRRPRETNWRPHLIADAQHLASLALSQETERDTVLPETAPVQRLTLMNQPTFSGLGKTGHWRSAQRREDSEETEEGGRCLFAAFCYEVRANRQPLRERRHERQAAEGRWHERSGSGAKE